MRASEKVQKSEAKTNDFPNKMLDENEKQRSAKKTQTSEAKFDPPYVGP
jgi:hypothetical protein